VFANEFCGVVATRAKFNGDVQNHSKSADSVVERRRAGIFAKSLCPLLAIMLFDFAKVQAF